MLVTKIPDGARIMIDSNIFLYAREGTGTLASASRDFLQRVANQEVDGYTSASIVAEVIHRVICSEAIRVHGLTPRTVVNSLKRQPDLVKNLTEHLAVAESIAAMNVVTLSVTADIVIASKAFRGAYGLLSNDSITVACMDAHGLTDLATHNGDFDRVTTIQTYKPVP